MDESENSMSAPVIIHAIKIKVAPVIPGVAEHTELGFFVKTSEIQEIRWTEMPLVGTPDVWTSGIIAKNGIGDIRREMDTRSGGASEAYSGLDLKVLNNNQLVLRLKELGIDINGLTAEVHEFIGTDADSDAMETSVRFTGVCAYESGSSWDENLWNIEIKNNRFQRNAFLGTMINNDAANGNYKDATDDMNGKIVPITMGKFEMINATTGVYDPLTSVPNPAKFIRTAGKQTALDNYIDVSNHLLPEHQTFFPVIDHSAAHSTSPYLGYRIQMGNNTVGSPLMDLVSKLGGMVELPTGRKWLKIVVGGATGTSLVGQYRKITRITDYGVSAGNVYWVDVELETYFEKDLVFTGTDQAWVQFLNLPFEYPCDTWPCAGFLNDAGGDSSQVLNLYSYKSESSFLERKSYDTDSITGKLIINTSFVPIGFQKIAPYGYNAKIGGINNSLIIDAKLFESDPSQLLSYDIFPLKDRTAFIENTLTAWGFPTWNRMDGGELGFVPVFDDAVQTDLIDYDATDVGGANPDLDRKDSSYRYVTLQTDGQTNIKVVFEFSIDIEKLLFDYDSYYLGVNISTKSVNAGGTSNCRGGIKLLLRRFIGSTIETLSNANGAKLDDFNKWSAIDCLPDFYYNPRTTPDNNKAFIFDTELSSLAYPQQYLTCHKNFPLAVNTKEQIGSLHRVGLIYENAVDGTTDILIKMIEMSLICKMSTSISEKLFTLCKGRTFNSTWGSRKTSANMITNPVDMLEHFKRLQCGMEFGDVVEFGKAYSPSMPIKTGAAVDGSYDNAILDTVKTFTPAYQILDVGPAWTDTQIRDLCRTFHVCTYTDRAGYECVTTLDTTDPAETILFTDIKGAIGETKEPEIGDVFCQPIFNYRYNSGSEKFDKQMCVLNIQESTYNAAYTPGIDNTAHTLHATLHDGEYVWAQCKAKYSKYRQIEPCPSSFSDQKMIVTYVDAIKIFSMKISWMGKNRQPLSVFYSKGKDYHPGKHVKIMLPHQTNRMTVECVIEKIKISKNRNQVDLQLVLLEDVQTAFFFE